MRQPKKAASLAGVATSMTVVLAGIVFGALLWLGDLAGVFGIWLLVVVVPGFIAYLYSVAAATAAGYREPAPVAITQFNAVNIVAQVLHIVVFVLAVVWLARSGWPLQGALVVVAAVLPASFLLLATTGHLMAAFSPPQVVRLIRGMGINYAALVGITFVVAAVVILLAPVLRSFYMYLVTTWFAFALAAAGGHLLYRKIGLLDLPVVTIDEKRLREDRLDENRNWQAVMDEAYLLLRSGDAGKAYALLRGRIERDGDRIESYEAVYLGMLKWRMEHHTSQVAQRLVGRLVEGNEPQRALEIIEERLRHDDSFRPPAAVCIRMAAYARSVGHVATADALEYSPAPAAHD